MSKASVSKTLTDRRKKLFLPEIYHLIFGFFYVLPQAKLGKIRNRSKVFMFLKISYFPTLLATVSIHYTMKLINKLHILLLLKLLTKFFKYTRERIFDALKSFFRC